MWTSDHAAHLAELPVEALATDPTPASWHGPLVAMGTHCRDGAWVVSGPQSVAAALDSRALSVVPATRPELRGPAGPAADLMARMARFCDGAEHKRRRDLVMRLLPPVAEVTRIAEMRARDYLRGCTAPFDIMPLARSMPGEVLARALGLEAREADRAAALTGVLCDALAPSRLPREGTRPSPDAAAAAIGTFTASLGSRDPEQLTAVISILFQARDATAALIGGAMLPCASPAPISAPGQPGQPAYPGQGVEHALRNDAPVQCTRRTATADVQIGDAVIPAGAPVWIFLATAEVGTGMPATFGAGPHGCPGAAHASAIAGQVVTVLRDDCWRPVTGQRVEYEPRPNIRMPVRVLVTRP
jgi:cytochrome P450